VSGLTRDTVMMMIIVNKLLIFYKSKAISSAFEFSSDLWYPLHEIKIMQYSVSINISPGIITTFIYLSIYFVKCLPI